MYFLFRSDDRNKRKQLPYEILALLQLCYGIGAGIWLGLKIVFGKEKKFDFRGTLK
jgi:hypothetical protein